MKRKIMLLLLIISIITLYGCNKQGDNSKNQYDGVVAEIDYDGDNYILKTSNSYGLEVYKNDELVQRGIPGAYKYEILSEPSTKISIDITGSKQITKDVFETDLETGYKYINYLLDDGYNIDFKAKTYKFLEYYLSNDATLKRVIITNEYTIISEVDEIPELNIRNYIF